MSGKTMGLILSAVGLVVLILSLAADSLGLGAAGGIGWKQLLGAAVGVIVGIAGFWMTRNKSK